VASTVSQTSRTENQNSVPARHGAIGSTRRPFEPLAKIPAASSAPWGGGREAVGGLLVLAVRSRAGWTDNGGRNSGVEPRPTVRPPMTFGPPNFGVERHLKNLRYAITSLAPHGPVVWRLERVPSGSPGQMTGTSTWRPNSASIVPMTSPSVAYECTASMRAGMRLTSGSAASARTRSNDASTVAWSRS
jgi:hypothetical protein